MSSNGCTPYCEAPCSAACEVRHAVRLYLDTLESTSPPPKVQAVIDEMRAGISASEERE